MSILGNNLLAEYYAQQEALPNEYRRVEYLESTGTQYIKTLVTYRDSTYVSACVQGVELLSDSSIIFAFGISGGNWFGCPVGKNVYGVGLGSITTVSYFTKAQVEAIFSSNKINVIVNNSITSRSGAISSESQFYIFSYGSFSSKCRIYNLKIIQNDILVRQYIPCVRKSDGKPGLYDLCKSICPLTNTPFYIKDGTGEFVTP